MNRRARPVWVEPEPFTFCGASWDWRARGLVLMWLADVHLRDLVLMRVVVVGLSWPPVRWATRTVDIST